MHVSISSGYSVLLCNLKRVRAVYTEPSPFFPTDGSIWPQAEPLCYDCIPVRLPVFEFGRSSFLVLVQFPGTVKRGEVRAKTFEYTVLFAVRRVAVVASVMHILVARHGRVAQSRK